MTLSETKAVYQLCLHWADHKHTCITLLAAFERCSLNCCCIQIYRRCGIKWEVAWILLMQDDSHSTCGASALMLPSFFRIYPRTCCALRCVQDVGLHYANVKACMEVIGKLLTISLLLHLLTQNVVTGAYILHTHLKTYCRCSSVCCQPIANKWTNKNHSGDVCIEI